MKNFGQTILSKLLLLFFILFFPTAQAMQPNQNNPFKKEAAFPSEHNDDATTDPLLDDMEDEDQEEPGEEAQDQNLGTQPTDQQATVDPFDMDEEEIEEVNPFAPSSHSGSPQQNWQDVSPFESSQRILPLPRLQLVMRPNLSVVTARRRAAPRPGLTILIPADPTARQEQTGHLEFVINDQDAIVGLEEIPIVPPVEATDENNTDTKESKSKKKMGEIEKQQLEDEEEQLDEDEIEKLADDSLYEIMLYWLGSSDIDQDTLSEEALISIHNFNHPDLNCPGQFSGIFDNRFTKYLRLHIIVRYANNILKSNKHPFYLRAISSFLKLLDFKSPKNGQTTTIRIEKNYALFCLLQAHKLLCDGYGANNDNPKLILIRKMIDAVIAKYHPKPRTLSEMLVLQNHAEPYRLHSPLLPFVIHCEYFPLADRMLTHLSESIDYSNVNEHLRLGHIALLELTSNEIYSNEKIQLIAKVIKLLLPLVLREGFRIDPLLARSVKSCIITTIFTLLRITNLNTFFAGLQRNGAVHEAIINQMVSPVTFAQLQTMQTDGSRSFLAYLRRQANLVFTEKSVMPVGQALLIAIRLGDTELIKTILKNAHDITTSYTKRSIQAARNNNNFQLAQALIEQFGADDEDEEEGEWGLKNNVIV